MANNRLIDVKDILMAQLQDLSNTDLEGKELEDEIKRAKAMVGVASEITKVYSLSLQAKIIADKGKFTGGEMPQQFLLEENNK